MLLLLNLYIIWLSKIRGFSVIIVLLNSCIIFYLLWQISHSSGLASSCPWHNMCFVSLSSSAKLFQHIEHRNGRFGLYALLLDRALPCSLTCWNIHENVCTFLHNTCIHNTYTIHNFFYPWMFGTLFASKSNFYFNNLILFYVSGPRIW